MNINDAIWLLKVTDFIEKGKKMPIGTISHGRKKVAEGKWVPIRKNNGENIIKHIKSKVSDISRKEGEGEIKLYRVIKASDISQIDLKSLGNHWTKNHMYKHNTKFRSEKLVRIISLFDKKDINDEASKFSNSMYPNEQEIVVNKNSVPKQTIIQLSDKNGDFYLYSDLYEIKKTSTGNRQDLWVSNFNKPNYG